MTPQQQTALEAIAGRALTPGEVALATLRNDGDLAASLAVGRVRLSPHLVGERGILDVLGPVAGDAFLTALEAISTAADLPAPLQPYYGTIRRGVAWLKTDGLDVGSVTTRALLDSLAASGIVDPAAVAAIKVTAEQPDPIATHAVSDVLNEA